MGIYAQFISLAAMVVVFVAITVIRYLISSKTEVKKTIGGLLLIEAITLGSFILFVCLLDWPLMHYAVVSIAIGLWLWRG